MKAFTCAKMHYLVEILFCDLVWPLYLFIFMELSVVVALFALFYKHQVGTNWDIALMP